MNATVIVAPITSILGASIPTTTATIKQTNSKWIESILHSLHRLEIEVKEEEKEKSLRSENSNTPTLANVNYVIDSA